MNTHGGGQTKGGELTKIHMQIMSGVFDGFPLDATT